MNEDKKSVLTNSSGITTGGLGAVLTTLVPLAAPETDSVWRPFLYALAPLISAFVTYFMVWVINRHGLESPAEASLRNRLERDLKGIDKQLESQHITEKFREELILDREATVRKIVNIGKNIEVTAFNPTDKD